MSIGRTVSVLMLVLFSVSSGAAQEAVQANPPARVRLRLENAEQLVGTLRLVTPDSVSLETSDASLKRQKVTRVDTVTIPRIAIQQVEISTYRPGTVEMITGAVLGAVVGTAYVFRGHPGLPHIGQDEGDGGLLTSYLALEPLLYATPFAILGGLLTRTVVPERWAPASFAAAPYGAGGVRLVIRHQVW